MDRPLSTRNFGIPGYWGGYPLVPCWSEKSQPGMKAKYFGLEELHISLGGMQESAVVATRGWVLEPVRRIRSFSPPEIFLDGTPPKIGGLGRFVPFSKGSFSAANLLGNSWVYNLGDDQQISFWLHHCISRAFCCLKSCQGDRPMEGGRWMFNCFASLFAQSRWRNAHQMAGFSLAGSSKLPSASEKNRIWKKLDYAWKGDCFSWVSEGYSFNIYMVFFHPGFGSCITKLELAPWRGWKKRILAMIRIGWPVAAPETLGWCTIGHVLFLGVARVCTKTTARGTCSWGWLWMGLGFGGVEVRKKAVERCWLMSGILQLLPFLIGILTAYLG